MPRSSANPPPASPLLPSTSPLTWGPLALDTTAPRSVTHLFEEHAMPQLPDGQGMDLTAWGRTVREQAGALPHGGQVVPLAPSADALRKHALHGDALQLATLLEARTHRWDDEALHTALCAALKANIPWDPSAARAHRMGQELAVALLLAVGVPVNAIAVDLALNLPNQALVLRLLRAWPPCRPGTPEATFEIVGRGGYRTTLLHQMMDSELWPERSLVLEALLATGHPVDLRERNTYRTPLACAALNQDRPGAQRLLAAGAAINGADRDGYTPLYWMAGDSGLLAQMLDLGADPVATNRAGYSLVEVIVRHGGLRTMDVLADLLARSDTAPSVQGGTPLVPLRDEAAALIILQTWSIDPGLTPVQAQCKAILEARALRASLVPPGTGPTSTPISPGSASPTPPAPAVRRRL